MTIMYVMLLLTLDNKEILVDISGILDESDFTDSVHITQSSKNIIADKISNYIYEYTLKECS